MITIAKLGPRNKAEISINNSLQIGQSNCGANCLQSGSTLSSVNDTFLGRGLGN
jgi:hypothetical protein